MKGIVHNMKKRAAEKIISGLAAGSMAAFLAESEKDLPEAEKLALVTARAIKFMADLGQK